MFESINKSTVSQSQKLITGPSPVLLRMCVEHSVTSDTFLKRPRWAEVCEMERSPGGEEKNLCREAEGTRARCVAIWQLHSNTADPVIQRRKWICSLAPEWRAATNGLKFRGRHILDQLKKECYKQLNSPNMECTVQSCDCVMLEVFKQSWEGPLVTPFHREECVLGNLSLILIPGLQQGSGFWSSHFPNLCWSPAWLSWQSC